MRAFLTARAVLFVVVFPGTVTVYIPWRILRSEGLAAVPPPSIGSILAALVVLAGAGVLLSCVCHFAVAGRGTLAPVDPPRRLVVSGLYRFCRNPMYSGVLTILVGEAWLFSSLALLEYAAVVLVLVHLVVVLYEEPALTRKFGESYRSYRAAVPRWGLTLHPWPRSADQPVDPIK